MNQFETLNTLAKAHGGYLQTADAVKNGISKTVLAKFVKEYDYERVAHEIYLSPEKWDDSMYLLQLRYPKTVFSHGSALYLLDMTDRDLLRFTVTVKTGYSIGRVKEKNTKVFFIKEELFNIGIMKAKTIFGNEVSIYNPERTICDMIRSRSQMDSQVYTDGLKEYVKRRDKDLTLLMEYARIFHVEYLLKRYLEVLL